MDHFDSIIIGAGHNGLVCAAYLAKAGQQVLVLEAADNTGGLAACREFHAGFKTSVAHSVNHFPNKIIKGLALEAHGLRAFTGPTTLIGLNLDGNHVVLNGGSLGGVGANDVDSYEKYKRLMGHFADALKPFWLKTIPRAAIERGIGSLNDLLNNGEQINASRVISAADPQTTFLKLVGVEHLEIEFSNRIRRLRCEGYCAGSGPDDAPDLPGCAVLHTVARTVSLRRWLSPGWRSNRWAGV